MRRLRRKASLGKSIFYILSNFIFYLFIKIVTRMINFEK